MASERYEKYKQELQNIKQYLISEGVNVDRVTMWQGGFAHEGTKYGLEIIARVEIDGMEESYCVPRHIVRPKKILEHKKFLKLENHLSEHIE